MYLATLAFLVGILTLFIFKRLPPFYLFLPIIPLLIGFSYKIPALWRRILHLLCFALAGCIWVCYHCALLYQWELPKSLETQIVTLSGTINDLPAIKDGVIEFELLVDNLNAQHVKTLIRLSWYRPLPVTPLLVGDRWQFKARLKRPHSLLNPGSFDYEKWLFSKGIQATGYVVNVAQAKRLAIQPWRKPIDRFRQLLQQKIQINLHKVPAAGLVIALIMGSQNDITQQQWQVMRATGTNHLMAIAGVHIAFVTAFMHKFINYIWRRSPFLVVRLPAPQAAVCAALLIASFYSALAGFGLPTQRALIMLAVCMFGLLLRQTLTVWHSMVIALLFILLLDPFSVLSLSFWLSFAAVFGIIYGITGRLKPRGLWWKYGRVQWVITWMLIPFSLIWFQQSSLISFIANLFAVPIVGILVLPLCLLGALLLFLLPFLGYYLLLLAAKLLTLLWEGLDYLAHLKLAVWHQTIPNHFILLSAILGVLIWIAPQGLPIRWVGVFWLCPLLFFQKASPAWGTMRLSVLDVGQGLSVVIQTQHHALIFDTGPTFGADDDAGQRIILPFLRTYSISQIDMLIVSHGDNDHIGGAHSLLTQFLVKAVLSSVPERFLKNQAHTCQAGQTWEWDGIRFRILYPPADLLHQGNNSSCVLRIETPAGAVLLTGDIEKAAENYLLNHSPNLLSAVLLIAPHHGSASSSTPLFVQAVHPKYVVFSVGYQNRYHFPNPSVIARYKHNQHPTLLQTDQTGAILFEFKDKNSWQYQTQRQLDAKIWRPTP